MDKKTTLWIMLIVALAAVLVVVAFNVGPSQDDLEALKAEKEATERMLEQQQTETQQKLDEVKNQISDVSSKLTTAEQEAAAKQAELEAKEAELLAKEAEIQTLKEAPVATEETVSVDGEVIDNLFLGDMVSFTVDDGDVAKLFDGEVTFDEDEYDVHEELLVLDNKAYILYSAIDDEELEERPALGFTQDGALEYRFVFDDTILMSDVSDEESLIIRFLGENLEIIEADADELVLRTGTRFILREGESIEFEGQEVTLAFVGENGKASVCVDGDCDTIAEFDTETLAGLDVRVDELLVNSREGIATLYFGPDTTITQEDGDEWLDEDDSPWKFKIIESGGYLESLVLVYDETHDRIDDDFPPFFEGDSISLPNGWLTVTVNEVLEDEYTEYTFVFDEFHDELFDDTKIDNDYCMLVESDTKDGIEVLDEETDEVYVCEDGKAYYQDSTNDWFEAFVTDVELVNDDARVSLAIGGAGRVRLENPNDILIRLDTQWATQTLGAEEDESESSDILFGSDGIGEREETLLTPFGAVIVSPEANADRDEFTYRLPTDRVEVELLIS